MSDVVRKIKNRMKVNERLVAKIEGYLERVDEHERQNPDIFQDTDNIWINRMDIEVHNKEINMIYREQDWLTQMLREEKYSE